MTDGSGSSHIRMPALTRHLFKNETRVDAVFGSVFSTVSGADRASAGSPHVTINMPYATTESTGFPESGREGGAYIMAAGTSEAHLMTP